MLHTAIIKTLHWLISKKVTCLIDLKHVQFPKPKEIYFSNLRLIVFCLILKLTISSQALKVTLDEFLTEIDFGEQNWNQIGFLVESLHKLLFRFNLNWIKANKNEKKIISHIFHCSLYILTAKGCCAIC